MPVRYCYHFHLTQEESEATKHSVTFSELLRQEMAKQGFELEPAWIEACEGLTTLLDTQEVQYAHYRHCRYHHHYFKV